MSIKSRLRSWLIGSEPAPVVAAVAPVQKSEPFTVRALEMMLAFVRATKPETDQPERRLRSFKLPEPAPGVLPANAPKMAQDSQIKAVIGFGEQYQWDGYGFMGYALLTDLGQIPEFRRPSEIWAEEMTRKWVKIISTSEDDKSEKIKGIEAELKRFGVQEAFRRAFECNEFFGIGKIYMDFGADVNRMQPIVLAANVEKDSLRAIKSIEPIWCYPNNYNTSDPTSPQFYKPQTWYLLGTETHASRLLEFVSRPVGDILKPAYMFGGVSLTQLLQPYVNNWLRTRQSVSNITHNFSTMVLQTDMGQMMLPGGAAALALRGQIYNTARDNLGVFIADKTKEDLKNVSAPLGGLDKLQAQAQEQMAAIAGIPLVKLFGIQPAGLNASSDGEIRVFYDEVAAKQEQIGTPALRTLLSVIQMNKYGVIDQDISFKWEPLWSLDEKGLAEVRKINAETDCAYVDHAILSEEEVRKTIAGEEDSRYSSIEVDDLPDLGEESDDADGGEDVPERDAPDATLPHAGEKKEAA